MAHNLAKARISGATKNYQMASSDKNEVTASTGGFALGWNRRRSTLWPPQSGDRQSYTYSSTSFPVEKGPEAVTFNDGPHARSGT